MRKQTTIYSLILLSFSLLAACQSATPRFHTMSEEELYAYNAGRPVMEQVYCTNEARTSTYIRRRRCQTVEQYVNEAVNAPQALDVLNYGRNFNDGIGRRYD